MREAPRLSIVMVSRSQVRQLGIDEDDRGATCDGARRWPPSEALDATIMASTCCLSKVATAIRSRSTLLSVLARMTLKPCGPSTLSTPPTSWPHHGFETSAMTRPTVWVCRLRMLEATPSTMYPSSDAHSRTRAAVSLELMPSTPRRTRDTVAGDTFAARATSAMVGVREVPMAPPAA